MKSLIAFFTSNWGLKILALVLAIVVYYSLKDKSAATTRPDYPSPSTTFLKGPANGGK